jgi:hypothetical protein
MAKRINPDLTRALDRLANAEAGFVGAQFLAPVLRGTGVGVSIAGVRCRLKVRPWDFEGWGVFRAQSFTRAKLVCTPTMAQRRMYLGLFPPVRLILVERDGDHWLAGPAGAADARFTIEGLVPVRLVEDGEFFETIVARFDGGQFWFDQVDPRTDPSAASLMRDALLTMVEPARLERAGMTAAQRAVYTAAYDKRRLAIAEDERTREERRLRNALTHAGATLRDYAERGGVYRVSYDVDGQRRTSVIRKDDLTVVTAGICLAGQDGDFDLSSLVGVLRESDGRFRR